METLKKHYRCQLLEGPYHWQIIDESCLQVALVRHWPEKDGYDSEASKKITADLAHKIVGLLNKSNE